MLEKDDLDRLAERVFSNEADENMPDRDEMLKGLEDFIHEFNIVEKKPHKRSIYKYIAAAACLVVVITLAITGLNSKNGYADDFRKFVITNLVNGEVVDGDIQRSNIIPGEERERESDGIIEKTVTLNQLREIDDFEYKEPNYLPEGYRFMNATTQTVKGILVKVSMTYHNPENSKEIQYIQKPAKLKASMSLKVDVDEAVIEIETRQGIEYTAITFAKVGLTMIEWDNDEVFYKLEGYEPKEEIWKVAESINK